MTLHHAIHRLAAARGMPRRLIHPVTD